MKDPVPFDPRKRRLAVLKGGPGSEREVSLRSGESVARALRAAGAEVEEIEVTGTEVDIPHGTELAFNLIHGTFGEDGELQSLMEQRGIPYTGEGSAASRVAFDKILTKRALDQAGVPTPRWEILRAGEQPTLPLPIVIKAPRQGSSVGVHLIRSQDQIAPALADCLLHGEEILVEELVAGRELTVGILGDHALPVVEIRPREGFYDYTNKYTKGATDYLVPAPLNPVDTEKVQALARAANQALGLRVYCRVDILLSPSGPTVLEINTIPGMTETSLLPKAAAASGLDFVALCLKIASLSLVSRAS
ncbi:MAG: D-alanine--D-alanine ligase [bacterium]